MTKESTKTKAPLTRSAIYKIMIYLCYIVSGVFFVKDLLGGEITGSILIAVCLALFSLVLYIMKLLKFGKERKRFVVSISLIVLIFFISLGSGNYYSDDFPMYLAALGLTGLYLRPKYTKWQLIASTILLALQYVIFPHKAENYEIIMGLLSKQ